MGRNMNISYIKRVVKECGIITPLSGTLIEVINSKISEIK